jgi:putative colanic acid biosynthesis UDP-glucose lipid carrier transferase
LGRREQVAENRDWVAVSEGAAALQPPAPLRLVDAIHPDTARDPQYQALPASLSRLFLKRSLDLAIATILLVLLAPLLILAAIAIRLESPGPALFRQWRHGLNGRPFRILKLRTLTVTEDGDTIAQVTRGDSRVTGLGRVFRKISFDELPQLINVIRGDMSLVGPRPHALAHDHYFNERIENYAIRQCVKPGLTGWAQIHGLRGETATLEEMRRRVSFDLWYVRHAGFRLDLRILLATPRAVLGARNAW